MENSKIFINHLEKNGYMVEGMEQNNIKAFKLEQQLKCGTTVTLLFTFEDKIVDVHLLNYFKINDLSKMGKYLELINDLNTEYRFATFFITHRCEVAIKYSFTITEEFDPEYPLAYAMIIIEAADSNYEKLLHL